ncbi:hypothetical protein [Granulicella sibirica]|uniref:Uncharacterized protein n=1 Tax=Granulicella sibirica TaxID=2479048 RepID=A0A4Q0T1V6_9BACT|nr:hypothetical protein [Granulicella sibirica]RXH56792.1 hypothetical protein GRAN_0102 [Granulicella sibirica]
MQIELNESAAQILKQQASAHGRSVDDYAAAVLTRFASASQAVSEPQAFEIASQEDALLWMLRRNPNVQANRPEDSDRQQLKNEGRRF